MIELTRVGNVVVLEYFSEEEKRILEGKDLKKSEKEKHFRMLAERDYAFSEIARLCKERALTEYDPLKIEPNKYRNENALANPFLRF